MEIKKLDAIQAKEIANFILEVMNESKHFSRKISKNLDNLKLLMYFTLKRDMENETLHCYGIIEDNNIVAMVGYEPVQNEITYLYVHPSYQRKGLGTKLLDVAISNMSSSIISINSAHKDVVGMYEKYGFYKTGESTENSVSMEYITRR